MNPKEQPPVEGAEPPERLAKVVNPVVKALLCSPLHQLVSEHLMLLTFSGRKTGSTYTVVVGRHAVNGALVVPVGTTGRRWRLNFRGGAPVVVTIEGRRRRGRGELVEDPEEVACVHELLLDRLGQRESLVDQGRAEGRPRRPGRGPRRTKMAPRTSSMAKSCWKEL